MQSRKPLAKLSTHSPILRLANELLQKIACYLPTDRDVLHFSQSCKDMWAKVFAGESAVWRDRFGRHYDTPRGKTYKELKAEYMTRAIVLNGEISFKEEENDRQYLWMEVIQTMFKEAVTLPMKPTASKTVAILKETLKKVNFLRLPEPENPGTSSPLFYALQLCLTAFALDLQVTEPCRRTDYDIQTIYSIEKSNVLSGDSEEDEFDNESQQSNESEFPPFEDGSENSFEDVSKSATHEPFIDHKNLNLAKLLQFRSFWQRHLLNTVEYTFQESFCALSEDFRPKVRKDDPNDTKLSSSWMGYYSCIHSTQIHPVQPRSITLRELRDRQTCADGESHIEEVEVMTLDLEHRSDLFWPEECKTIAPLAEVPDAKRVAFDGKQGSYGNEDSNLVFGFTEDIDVAHGGFSGWKRICFTICENVPQQDSPHLSPGTDGWVHIYEAVIIPGGRIMLGRWVDLKEPWAKGPFIFWDV